MLTLAMDTAAAIGSIALADERGIIAEARLEAPGGFGQVLFREIEGLLARARVRLADIELYAAASGPGSFTGVRIGLAAIKGLAEVAGKPAVGVSNLDALAQFGGAGSACADYRCAAGRGLRGVADGRWCRGDSSVGAAVR